MLLVALHDLDYQAAALQTLQLPLHGSASYTRKLDQLLCKKASLWLAEEQRENALLRGGEQSVGDAGVHRRSETHRRSASVGGDAFGSLGTHFG
jgi:hypothetical protein